MTTLNEIGPKRIQAARTRVIYHFWGSGIPADPIPRVKWNEFVWRAVRVQLVGEDDLGYVFPTRGTRLEESDEEVLRIQTVREFVGRRDFDPRQVRTDFGGVAEGL